MAFNASFSNTSNSKKRFNYGSNASTSHGNNSFVDQFQNRVFLRELLPGVTSKKLIGLVISKYDARSFPDRKNPGDVKYNQMFTLRDTVDDYINVVCWGSETFIDTITNGFRIGDVVEINNCMVQTKQNNEFEMNYRPSTPTPFQIVVNEPHSTVIQFSGSDFSEFSSIMYIPVKDHNDYYTLGDVVSNGNNLHNTYINVLAAVRETGVTKDIVTKTGKQMKRREIKLFDESCTSFPLMIWDGEMAELADSWTSKESVLFICDVKVTYDDFRRKMIATCSSKTIIITNPDTPEAHRLYNYAQTATLLTDENLEVDLSLIQDVYNLNDLGDKLESFGDESHLSLPFYGIIYGVISNFNIDIEGKRCIISRCTFCKRRVNNETGICLNPMCVTNEEQTDQGQQTNHTLEIRVSLSDHTGGIDGFLISRDVAERLLNYDVNSFNSLDVKNKTDLKWKFLFERFKVYFKASPSTQDYWKPFLNVLSIDQADVGEMLRV